MKDLERYNKLNEMFEREPYASSYTISDSNFNFLMRKFEENKRLIELNRFLKDNVRDLESQVDRVQAILGTDTFA